ncbi:MAG TPA: DUF4383 domain-containing protein [Dehalococcoidia bacterium]|nr:DUF4383 domain-containing protein [Dehalococcoidia bacterium]
MIDRERDENVAVTERRVIWAPWSPAQLVALAFGVFFVVIGAVAMARGGLDANTFDSKIVNVLGFDHTALLGVIELVFGLLLLLAGALPGAGRGTMAFLGVAALGFGIVVLATADQLRSTLGVTTANGWLYVITGIVNLVVAMVAPVIFTRQRHVAGYRDDVLHRV